MMLRALQLGEKGRLTAPPNPWVGCVIEKNGTIIGEGYHIKPGEPHAEAIALKKAGKRAKGATLFSTLEPCCHTGRTPPCVDAIIKAGISHVMISVTDPDPNVNGGGIQRLKSAGIKVTMGVLEEEGKRSLAPYLHHRKTKRPYCVAKAAISIDGRVAAKDFSSKWITSEEARQDAHSIRQASQAILVGAKTAQYDKPRLTTTSPLLRVVLDSKGTVPHVGPLFDQTNSTLLVTANPNLEAPVEVLKVSPSVRGVNLIETLEALGKRGVLQLMIEGGGEVLSSFLQEGLINELTLYIGPRILGDEGVPLFKNLSVPTINNAPNLKLLRTKTLGDCVKILYSLE